MIKKFIPILSLIYIFTLDSANSQTFTKITTGTIVTDGRYSEGAYWFDYNNDRYLDLFVGNIVNQNNLLYLNNGDGTFTQITTGNIVNDAGFSYGGCFGDYNNDGYPDMFVENGGSNSNQANFLYINNSSLSFTKITSGNIVTDAGGSWGSATADYDRDGNLDIFVSNFNQNNFLYKGNGDGTFTKIATGDIVNDGGASLGCSWADYDNDGYPDLFVANANFGAGQNNFLYHNNGNGTFTKITTGNIVTDGGNSVGGSWGDYDNDGDMDLYVPNYFNSNNFLYRNDGLGTFTKITTGIIVNDGGSSVGSAWGDYDNDGDLDLFVSNDNNENNALYENNGNGTFTKITTGDIVNDGGRSNGSVWGDYDNDGDIDLFVTNGDQPTAQSNFLYKNDGNSNHWINILSKGINSNRSAIGTKVVLKTNINGNNITQTQGISGQTGYNAQNSLNVEFGLGNASVIDSLIIIWPNGNIEPFANISSNQFVTVTEGKGIVGVNPGGSILPGDYRLEQNYPNPFNPTTEIAFSLPHSAFTELKIFDITGREIASPISMILNAGSHIAQFNSSKVASGTYFYRIKIYSERSNEVVFSDVKKMVVLK